MLVPLWLIVSAGFAIYHRINSETAEEQRPRNQFSRSISAQEIGDDVQKITTWIGERHPNGEAPSKNLSRASAWIDGLLGPSNTGYVIEKKQGPLQWPILTTTLPSMNTDKSAVWIVASYDSKPGSIGIETNATGLIASIAAARALAGSDVGAPIHFAFLPHVNDPNSPRLETAALLKNLISANHPPKAVLCIEAMGAQEKLQASSRDTALLANLPLHDLATALEPAPLCLNDDKDLASVLFDMGLPSARISTRPPLASDEPDNQIPAPATIAQSAIYLTELIKRCVNSR